MASRSASKTALWFVCQHFARDDISGDVRPPSMYANFGKSTHTALEVIRAGETPDLQVIADTYKLPPHMRLALPGAVRALTEMGAPALAISELALSLNLHTGEVVEVGRGIERNYGRFGSAPWFPGSIDLCWMDTRDRYRDYVVVVDVKSGFEGKVADHRPQLMSLGAKVVRLWSARGAVLRVLHVKDGDVVPDEEIVEDYELDAHVDDLRALQAKTPNAEPNPGPHCRDLYCPAFDTCKAGQRLYELVALDRLTVKLRGPIASEDEASARAELRPLLHEALRRYDQDLKDWIDVHGDVRTRFGRYGRVEGESREIIPTPEAMEILREELGGDEIEVAGVARVEITQSAIKRKLEELGIRPISAALARTMLRLEKAGAIKKHPDVSYEFRKAANR